MRWGRRQTRIPSGPLPNSLERQTTRAFARPNGEHGVGNSVAVYLVVILYIQRAISKSGTCDSTGPGNPVTGQKPDWCTPKVKNEGRKEGKKERENRGIKKNGKKRMKESEKRKTKREDERMRRKSY